MRSFVLVVTLAGLAVSSAAAGNIPADVKKRLRASDDDERQQAVQEAARAGQADAVSLLLPIAAGDKDGRVRDTAFNELRQLPAVEAAPLVVKYGLQAKDGAVRAVAAEILGWLKVAATAAPLIEALADREAVVRRAAAEALGYLKAASAADPLVTLIESDRDPIVRSVAVESLSRIGGPGVVEQLQRFAREGSEEVRLQALHSLRYHDRQAAAREVVTALADLGVTADAEIQPLLVQAIEEARSLRSGESIPYLIELLDHPRGRIVDLAFTALRDVTGMELPDDAASWREWWQHYGATFQVPKKGKQDAAPGASRSRVRFYGAPILSDRVVFVIDYSGSMRDAGAGGVPKIDTARAALREVLEALPESAQFNLVTFSDEPRVWQQYLVPVRRKNVDEAMRFLESSPPRGYTNVFDALEAALGIQGVDTIVLLSDGSPSTGRYEHYSRIRTVIGRQNRIRKVAISTVALATHDNAREFLKQLAEESGGRYVEAP